MIADGFALLDPIHTPQENGHGVEQSGDGDNGEGDSGSKRNLIAKVEQGRSDRPQDDGELKLERCQSITLK